MRAIAINGSPRKKFNTATLLENALRGAETAGAQTELHHLGDIQFNPCKSCLACKSKRIIQNGKCVQHDALTPILEDALTADVLILGSPVYFYTESAYFRGFLERLIFPLTRYTSTDRSIFQGKKPVGLILSMNITDEEVISRTLPFPSPFSLDIATKTPYFLKRVFGSCETQLCTDTMQVNDYSAYHMEIYDAQKKEKRHQSIFPEDCRKAFELGKHLTMMALSEK